MKHAVIFVSIVILICALYVMFLNGDNILTLKYFASNDIEYTREISLVIYSLINLFVGLLVGAGIVFIFLSVQNEKLKAYKRELERASVSGINNSSKVDVLEAKIKTLEKAFDTVIDERKQMEIKINSLNSEIETLNRKK